MNRLIYLARPDMTKLASRIAMAALMSCVAAAPQAAPQADPQASPQATPPPKTAPATHVTKDQIQEFIAKLPRGRILDSPIRAVDVGGYRVGVFAVLRPKDSPQDAIYHDTNMTEILYMLEGTLVVEVDGKPPITLKAGDVAFFPAGVVHNGKNTSSASAKVLATYVLEKGKPVATPAP